MNVSIVNFPIYGVRRIVRKSSNMTKKLMSYNSRNLLACFWLVEMKKGLHPVEILAK